MKSRIISIVLFAAAITMAFCLTACGGGSQPAKDNPLSIEGVYHPLTGTDEPAYFAGTTDYDTAVANEKKSEAESDTKKLFVVINLDAPDKENITVAKGQRIGAGDIASTAKLSVDGTNEYKDNWALNNNSKFKQVYVSELKNLGYGDGTDNVTLYGGSGDTYKAVFVFSVSNNDLENGEVGHLSWDGYDVEFNMTDVKEVESPLAMVEELSSAN